LRTFPPPFLGGCSGGGVPLLVRWHAILVGWYFSCCADSFVYRARYLKRCKKIYGNWKGIACGTFSISVL
jgi:hypothetical protein